MTMIKEERLDNGLTIVFVDESNRYFGDYHRVCVVATIVCKLRELPADNADDESFRNKAIETLGEELTVVKRFERMGVPTADIEKIRAAMIDGFLQNSSPYLARAGYPRALVNAELKKRRTHRYYG